MDRETRGTAIPGYMPLAQAFDGLAKVVSGVLARHAAHIDHSLCAYCYWPRYTHAQGKYQWCPVDNGGEVYAALLCDYCGAESRDGLADGDMCGASAVVVGIESGQCYCERHWQRQVHP
jgi:hypothetical protein